MRLARFVALLALAGCKHAAPTPAPAPSASAPSASAAVVVSAGGASPGAPEVYGPSSEALAQMRATFHAAAAAEAGDPARAATLYEKAYGEVPTLAALLGEARAAGAKGDAALARTALARALAFAERDGGTPRVAVTADVDDVSPRILDVENDFALLAMNRDALVIRQELSTGALGVVAGLPEGSTVFAASAHLAVVRVPASGTSVFALGVDDATTAEPLEALRLATGAAISRDEALVGVMTDTGATVIDAKSHKALGSVDIGAPTKKMIGFTASGKRLVVKAADRVCVVSAPSWSACAASPALRGASSPGAELGATGGELVAFAPNDTTFRVFDTEVNRTVVSLTGHFASVNLLALSPDGSTLLSSSFSRTVTWDVATHARHELAHEDYDFQPFYSADGKHLVEAQRNAVLVRDASALSVWMPAVAAGSFPIKPPTPVVVFAPSGNLWVGGNRFVARLDLKAGTIRSYPIYGATIDLAVSPDERYFGAGDQFGNMGSNVYVYDAASGKQLSSNTGGMLGDMRFSGTQLIVLSGVGQEAIDIDTGHVTTTLPTPPPVSSIDLTQAASPDRKLRASVDSTTGSVSVIDAKGRASLLDIGSDAYVVTTGHKSQVFGNRASARCHVGASWLPLEACAPVLGTVSF